MTDVRTETVPLDDGSELRLTVAEPDGAARGGIVVLHEARGVTDGVRWLVHSLAMEGFEVVAPHLYHRDGADELAAEDSDEQVRDQVNRLTGASVMADTDTAFGWLADRGVTADRMGVIGFDLGGSVA
ncbi:MAG: dienelactone hydrolase family protein, partial [Pseudonocardia sp.]|nr:dienelactone hydrolase family protein [Pseudonocardia sp.]